MQTLDYFDSVESLRSVESEIDQWSREYLRRMRYAAVIDPDNYLSLWCFGQSLWVIVFYTKVILKTHSSQAAVS